MVRRFAAAGPAGGHTPVHAPSGAGRSSLARARLGGCYDHPLHDHPDPSPLVSDCRVVWSELATDLYTPLRTWLCFCFFFSAMVFTVCSCTASVYICLLFLCLAFSLQGGEAGGGSGRSCRSLHRLMIISTCLIALDCRLTCQHK